MKTPMARAGIVRPGIVRLAVTLAGPVLLGLVAAGCGSSGSSSEPEVECQAGTALATNRGVVSTFWWEEEAPPLELVSYTLEPQVCGPIFAETDQPWLEVTIDASSPNLLISADPGLLPTGIHTGTVTLHTQRGTPGFAEVRIPVSFSLWHSPEPPARQRVLVVGISGLRADAIAASDTPNIDVLARKAARSFNAKTQLVAPTDDGPGWASVLTGVDADKHGVVNDDAVGLADPAFPSFLWRARNLRGRPTAAAVNRAFIVNELLEPDALDASFVGPDLLVEAAMERSLSTSDHHVFFVQLGDVDGAGHTTGFDPANALYRNAIEAADRRLGDFLAAILDRPLIAEEDWLIVLTTDHGGEGREHGPKTPANRTIPHLLAGSSVSRERVLTPGTATHMDVHPSVLDWLEIEVERSWQLDGVSVPLRR